MELLLFFYKSNSCKSFWEMGGYPFFKRVLSPQSSFATAFLPFRIHQVLAVSERVVFSGFIEFAFDIFDRVSVFIGFAVGLDFGYLRAFV